MSVTVLMPVYNAGPYLHQAIASILQQSYQDFELLIVNDASTDRSGDIIQEYAKADLRITFISHDRNMGLAATLNEGLSLARYDLVARMDQDDEALPSRLAVQLDYMQSHPEVFVAGSFVYHMAASQSSDRLVQLPITYEQIRATLPRENCIYHPSVIMRRQKILDLGGYRAQFKNAEDYDLWLRVSKNYPLVNIPQPLLRYRFSVGGMTLSRKWEQLFYVCLAQVAHQHESATLEEIQEQAREKHHQINKLDFLRTVAKGTVDELVSLQLWQEARQIATNFAPDIGSIFAYKLKLYIAVTYLRRYLSQDLSAKK
ncbi:glycosyltransferase [Tumidithrix elongata RA019]|uniref:Glycosyltransferase n=1 Tax=Tumidithrix elongata BACA0141 TaxID=2716417 RepID=A0AAW9PUU0_9CYAN|nr:glycosyltransferase [Tumidithrix elongata RA019]